MASKSKKRRLKISGDAASSSSSSSAAAAAGGGREQPDPTEIRKLSHWLSRDKLESLVFESVTDGIPVTIADLQNSLPEDERWRFRPKVDAEVKPGPQRVGTGLFDDVDEYTMSAVFDHLNTMDRLVCTTSVCKAWRDFKTSIPGLFVDLSDDSLGKVEKVGSYVGRKAAKAKQVRAVLDWVPAMSAVTGLRISTDDGCNPNECKQIIKTLADAKRKAGVEMDLTTLVLQGPKISGSVVAEALKKGVGPTLIALSLEKVKNTKSTKLGEGAIPELLRNCPRLVSLRIGQSFMAESSLSFHLRALSLARSGAPTLLRVLDLTCKRESDWGAERLLLSEIAKIGTAAPELEVLKLEMVSGAPTCQAGQQTETPATFLSEPMTSLPRLKEFCVHKIVKTYVWNRAPEYATTDTVRRLLSWLLEAMPGVQDFTFGHGRSSMSNKDSRNFSTPTLPGIGADGGADLWPDTLKSLHLQEILLEANAFDSVQIPSLEKVTLKDCGTNVPALVQGLHRRHSGIKVGVSATRNGAEQLVEPEP